MLQVGSVRQGAIAKLNGVDCPDEELLSTPALPRKAGKNRRNTVGQLINQGDSNRIADEITEAAQKISREWTRPSVLFRPVITPDGDQFCCLLGSNLQEGITGFGYTPDQASRAFDEAWHKSV